MLIWYFSKGFGLLEPYYQIEDTIGMSGCVAVRCRLAVDPLPDPGSEFPGRH